MKNFSRIILVILSLAIVLQVINPVCVIAKAEEKATQEIVATLKEAAISGDATIENEVISVDGNAEIGFSFDSKQAFNGEVFVEYSLSDGSIRTIETGFSLGEQEYSCGKLFLHRVYKDQKWEEPDKKPKQILISEKIISPLRTNDQKAGEILAFFVKAGKNEAKLSFADQKIKIYSIKICEIEKTEKYSTPSGISFSNKEIPIEAEKAFYKSDSCLSATYDLTSSVTSPYSYDDVYLNTIGAATWNTPGQWISWKVYVEEPGYYCINFRTRQNESRGLNSYRRISIDDKVLCSELEAYGFGYDRSWFIETLHNSSGEVMYFWLEKGTHFLKMEAVMGEALSSYETISKAVNDLNDIYREILMLTGSSPDTNRSYLLFKKLPDLPEKFSNIANVLKKEIKRIENNNNSIGTSVNFINQFYIQLNNFSTDQDLVITSLASFKSNISSLASLLTTLSSMPLEIDKIVFSQKKDVNIKEDLNFFERMWFEFRRFILSFTSDYGSLEEERSGDSIKVWCMMGRDQAQIIKDMVNDTFKPQYGIGVEVSVVTAGLSEAIMAGKGPDVVMGVDRSLAINLGVREAFADISELCDLKQISSRFQKSAFNGYTYKNKTYAIPNTQEFNMLFIRTDIYDNLGLSVPNSWDELLKQLPIFSQYNMVAGIPSGIITTMLLQNGMNYYNEDLTETIFATEEAYDVYKDFISFYTDYDTPVSYDGANRFRSGEMPVVISSFSFFNTLTVLAPELQGVWDMYQIPGTVKPDGTIDRATEAGGSASAIIADSKHKQEAMKFLDWWTTTESQSRFGIELENILGKSGRYATANVAAFSTLNWSSDQMSKIQSQRAFVNELPETPVSYIISRNMSNIFMMTVNNGNNLKETMIKYSRHMNDEISRKYAELESYN